MSETLHPTPKAESEKPVRWAEIQVDPENPPQLIHPVLDYQAIETFLNTLDGHQKGRVTVILHGSNIPGMKELLANKNQISWKEVFALYLSTYRRKAGSAELLLKRVRLYLDDLLIWQLFDDALYHPRYNGDDISEFLRKISYQGSTDLRQDDGSYTGKALQHELDHIAKTPVEGMSASLRNRRKLFLRLGVATSLAGINFAQALSQINQPVTELKVIADIAALSGCAISLIAVLEYIARVALGRDPEYHEDGAEQLARVTSHYDQHLLSMSDADLAWVATQREAVSTAYESLAFSFKNGRVRARVVK